MKLEEVLRPALNLNSISVKEIETEKNSIFEEMRKGLHIKVRKHLPDSMHKDHFLNGGDAWNYAVYISLSGEMSKEYFNCAWHEQPKFLKCGGEDEILNLCATPAQKVALLNHAIHVEVANRFNQIGFNHKAVMWALYNAKKEDPNWVLCESYKSYKDRKKVLEDEKVLKSLPEGLPEVSYNAHIEGIMPEGWKAESFTDLHIDCFAVMNGKIEKIEGLPTDSGRGYYEWHLTTLYPKGTLIIKCVKDTETDFEYACLYETR